MTTFTPIIVYDQQLNNKTQLPIIEEKRIKIHKMLEDNAHLWELQRNIQSPEMSPPDQSLFQSPESKLIPSPSSIDSSHHYPRQMMDVLEPKARITTPPPYTHSYIRHKGYPMQEEEDDEEDTIKTTFINEPLFYDNTFKPHTNKKRRRGNLPKNVTEYLRQWLILHKKHPYPTEKEKQQLALETGLMVNQISNWFINARRRILQPMLESENRQLKISKDSRYYAEEDYLKGNNGYYYLDSSSDRGVYYQPYVLLPNKLPSINTLQNTFSY